jgi:hypothetical protein
MFSLERSTHQNNPALLIIKSAIDKRNVLQNVVYQLTFIQKRNFLTKMPLKKKDRDKL